MALPLFSSPCGDFVRERLQLGRYLARLSRNYSKNHLFPSPLREVVIESQTLIYYLKSVRYLINKLTIGSGISLSRAVWQLIREAYGDAFTVGIADFRFNLKSQIELPIHRRRFPCCCCLIWVNTQAREINPTFVINFAHFDNHFIAHRYFILNFANAVVS